MNEHLLVYGEYRLFLKKLSVQDGRMTLEYKFWKFPENDYIFSGSDFQTPYREPFTKRSAKRIAKILMDFLTLQPGDTDQEFFEQYTIRQRQWQKEEATDFYTTYME